MLKGKKILITGGLGFIGKNIVKELIKDNEIIIVDKFTYVSDKEFLKLHKNICFVRKDISDFKYVSDTNILAEDKIIILNFAAESHVDNSFSNSIEFTKSNVLSLHHFLEETVLFTKNAKFLHVSTDEVYGDNYTSPRVENSRLQPTNPYSASKAAADTLVQTYRHCFNLNAKIIRPNNIYGSGQYHEKLIPKIFSHIKQKKVFPVHGAGANRRHFLHTSDLLQAIYIIFRTWDSNAEIFNVASNDEFSVIELLNIIKQKINFDLEWECVEDRPYNDMNYLIDDKLLRNLGWEPKVNFLSKLIELSKEEIHGYP